MGEVNQQYFKIISATNRNEAVSVKAAWYINNYKAEDKNLESLQRSLDYVRSGGINEIMVDVTKIKLKRQEGKKVICLVVNNNEDNKQVFGMIPLNLKKWKKEYTALYEALVKQQSNYLLYVAYITDQNDTLNVADEDIIFKDEININ
jgi:uncharacterized lipoprotein YehR (DUF1307 family)